MVIILNWLILPELVELHRKGSAPEACAAGLFTLVLHLKIVHDLDICLVYFFNVSSKTIFLLNLLSLVFKFGFTKITFV